VNVAVTGATGTIGRTLVRELVARGDEVTALSRDGGRASSTLGVEALTWEDPQRERPPADALRGRDAVVNLLGENLARRWTESAKREIRDSRVLGTRNLVEGLRTAEPRPSVLISQSGSDWYAARGAQPIDESGAAGSGFLAGVTAAWEEEARAAEELGLRVVITRTGVVLAESGGALAKMLPFFRAGVGGPVAGGRQYMPWIHVDDVIGGLLFCLDDERVRGPVNLSAPEPVTNGELAKALGRVLRRPAFAPVPGFAVKALYGEMASIVTTGVRMVPGRLRELGYEFRRPDLEDALRAATGR
jgi:uncharacterized protein (TIGR01777 family)